MASSKPDDGQKLRAEIYGLEEYAERALLEVLRCLIKDMEFVGDDSKTRKTSPIDADVAMTEYFQHKESVLTRLYKSFTHPQKQLFYENSTLRPIIKISSFDISVLSNLLLNIPDFKTCYATAINVNRTSKVCTNGSHATDAKCCAVCDHKEGYCKSCHASKFNCKDDKYICCSNCNLCVHCRQKTAQPPCPVYELRFAINLIRLLRNLKSHTTKENWKSIATNVWMPDEFKFCGSTYEDLWNKCRENVECVYEYLKSSNQINDKEYRKVMLELLQLEDMTDNEQLITLAQKVVDGESGNDVAIKKGFEIDISLSRKSKNFSKNVGKWLTRRKRLAEYFNEDLDSTIVLKIIEILKETLTIELTTNEEATNIDNLLKFKLRCCKVYATNANEMRETEFIVSLRIQCQNLEGFHSLYDDPLSEPSKLLWKRFRDAVVDYVKKDLKLSINLARRSWEIGSILMTVCITKDTDGKFTKSEKDKIIRLIKNLPKINVFFENHTINADIIDDLPSNEDEINLSFTGELHCNLTHEYLMDIFPEFERKLQDQFEDLKTSTDHKLQELSDVDLNLKRFALVDPLEHVQIDEKLCTIDVKEVSGPVVSDENAKIEEDIVGAQASYEVASKASKDPALYDKDENEGKPVPLNVVTGYDVELADKIKSQRDNYTCAICTFIVKNAVEPPCGHLFCENCLTSWQKKKEENRLPITCPMCKQIYAPQEVKTLISTNKIIRSGLPVYCKERKEGCRWKGTIDDVEEHYHKRCKYLVDCPNERCDVKIIKISQLENHLTSCPFRKVDCPYCEFGCIEIITNIELNEHLLASINKHGELFRKSMKSNKDERSRHAKTSNELEMRQFDEMQKLNENVKSLKLTRDKLTLYKTTKEYEMNTDPLKDTRNKLEKEMLSQTRKLEKNIKSLQETQSKLKVQMDERNVENLIEQLKWFEENIINYKSLFKELLRLMQTDKRYIIKNNYYYKLEFNERWQKEWLCVYVADERSFDRLKTHHCTVHHNNNVCVRVYDDVVDVVINLLVEEGWTSDNIRRSIIHPKLHKKVDGYGVCKRDYCDCLVDGFILLQVCRK